MKLLVCICKVPDTTSKIAFSAGNTEFDSQNVQWIMNPTDEWYALVRAVELKEQSGGTVTVINVGGADNDQIIRKALAIGADDAIRVNCEPKDSYFVAAQIAHHAKEGGYDIVFTGKETIDYNGFQIGGMVAELLDQHYISLAQKLTVDGQTATAEREIEGGKEVIECPLPLVISATKGLAEQRIPNMRGIMQARSKPLNVVEPVAADELTGIQVYQNPPEKAGCKYLEVGQEAELVQLLKNEAKAI